MPKNSSAKYYQDNKERLQKKFLKDIRVFLNEKRNNIVVSNTKTSLKMKSKSWLSIQKNITK